MQGLSCSETCGIFSDQGLSPCTLYWQVDSYPLHYQGSLLQIFKKSLTTDHMDRNLDIRSVLLVIGLKMCIWQPEGQSHKEPASQSLMDILSQNSLSPIQVSQSLHYQEFECVLTSFPSMTEHITRIWSLLLLLDMQMRSPLGSPLSLKTCMRLFWALILHLEKVYCSLQNFSEFPGILHFHGRLSFQLPAPTEVLFSAPLFQSCSFSNQISTQRWNSALLLKIDFMF